MKISDSERAKIRETYLHTEDKHGYIDRMCEKYDMTRTQLMKELGTNAHELAGESGAPKKDAPARPQRYPEEVVEEAVVAVLCGERRARVAERVGCSRPALDKWVRDAKAAGAVPVVEKPPAQGVQGPGEAYAMPITHQLESALCQLFEAARVAKLAVNVNIQIGTAGKGMDE